MNSEILALKRAVDDAPSAKAHWQACLKVFATYGITGVGYGVIPIPSEARIIGNFEAGYFWHNYPADWEMLGDPDDPFSGDVSIDLIRDGADLVFWHSPIIKERASKIQLMRNEADMEIGMEYGVSIALSHSASGVAVSGIGLWMGNCETEAEFDALWAKHGEDLRALARVLDTRMMAPDADFLPNLTTRERDCLQQLALGLRPAEIAFGMGISEKTVEKYILSSKRKLNARTRDHAIVKATLLKLISL